MPYVTDLARERLRRCSAGSLTYSAALRDLGEGVGELYPDREAQVAAFGERLVVTIDLHTGMIDLHSAPKQ